VSRVAVYTYVRIYFDISWSIDVVKTSCDACTSATSTTTSHVLIRFTNATRVTSSRLDRTSTACSCAPSCSPCRHYEPESRKYFWVLLLFFTYFRVSLARCASIVLGLCICHKSYERELVSDHTKYVDYRSTTKSWSWSHACTHAWSNGTVHTNLQMYFFCHSTETAHSDIDIAI
jgi:hypothetical protein